MNEILPKPLLGLNAESMILYVRLCADRLLQDLGFKPIWNVKNPFSFIDNISIDGYANFFENKDPNYQRTGVLDVYPEDKLVEFDADF